ARKCLVNFLSSHRVSATIPWAHKHSITCIPRPNSGAYKARLNRSGPAATLLRQGERSMKAPAQKQSQPQPNIALQRNRLTWHTTGNQAVAASPYANTAAHQARSDFFAPVRFAPPFSRIPMHSHAPPGIQTKLAVGTPRDLYEQEADRIAAHVMGMMKPWPQRDCAYGCGCS